jgi:hypothetical protein
MFFNVIMKIRSQLFIWRDSIAANILSVLCNISSNSDILSAALLDHLHAHVGKGDMGPL